MATLAIDTMPWRLDPAPETLGEMLAAADARLAGAGRLVTAVRIDGVEEPAFRDPQAAVRPLDAGTRVEVDSGTPGELAAGCLREASQALQELAATAEDAARAFRGGAVRQGNQLLVGLTGGIGTSLAIARAVSLGLGLDVTRVATPHGCLDDVMTTTSRVLDVIVAAQRQEAWDAVAEALVQGLGPALGRWSEACAALDASRLG
jgi:hypothetical protein